MQAGCAECAKMPRMEVSGPVTAKAQRGYKTDEERGEFGAWLLRVMGDMSFEQLAKDMVDLGHAHEPAYYRAMASGAKKPGRIIRRALEERFASAPRRSEPAVPADQSAIVAAIRAAGAAQARATLAAGRMQAAAVKELAASLRLAFGQLDAKGQERAESFALALARVPAAVVRAQRSPEHSAQPGTPHAEDGPRLSRGRK